MATRTKKPTPRKQVEALDHDDASRKNIHVAMKWDIFETNETS